MIPRSQTQIPYDIYQAASAGTEKLAKIDKKALRKLLNVLASTIGGSGDELVRALVALDDVGGVLSTKSQQISALLRNTDKLSGILASSGGDIDALLARSSEVLDTLARRRASLRSLLAATQGLAGNLGTLVQVSRGSVRLGVRDLSSILTLAEEEMGSIDEALAEFERAQRLFAQNTRFGKFIEGHVCAITTEDTCVPYGSPQAAGLPIKGTQPSPSPSVSPILRAP